MNTRAQIKLFRSRAVAAEIVLTRYRRDGMQEFHTDSASPGAPYLRLAPCGDDVEVCVVHQPAPNLAVNLARVVAAPARLSRAVRDAVGVMESIGALQRPGAYAVPAARCPRAMVSA